MSVSVFVYKGLKHCTKQLVFSGMWKRSDTVIITDIDHYWGNYIELGNRDEYHHHHHHQQDQSFKLGEWDVSPAHTKTKISWSSAGPKCYNLCNLTIFSVTSQRLFPSPMYNLYFSWKKWRAPPFHICLIK